MHVAALLHPSAQYLHYTLPLISRLAPVRHRRLAPARHRRLALPVTDASPLPVTDASSLPVTDASGRWPIVHTGHERDW